uniref:Proton-coupled folate transporter n=1 Tax=Bursaphelenchus xylophilus TaxID=6326 RepID=A0A1I7SF59_BURXY
MWHQIQSFQIRMELVILAIAICDTARIVITPTLMEDKVKRVYVPTSDVANDSVLLKKFYNKKMVEWDQNYSYVNMPLAVMATIFFGSFSDKHGRKVPMIAGLLGMFVGNMIYIFVWWDNTDWPLAWLFLAAVSNGITGGFRMVTSSVNAYLSDQFEVKRVLSIRMIITYTILNVGDLIGSQLTKLLSHQFHETTAAFVMQAINLIVLSYVIFFVPNIKDQPRDYRFARIAKDGLLSMWASVKVVIRQRENYNRTLLWLTFTCVLLNRTAFNEEKDLIGTYTKLDPFHWTTDDFAEYKSYRPFTQIIGLLFGLFILKKLLKLKDTTIVIIATVSMGIDSLLIGLATSSLLIYISMAVGFMHALTNPLIFTLYSCLVDGQETGRVFALDSILQQVASFLKTAVLQTIYTHTLNWYQMNMERLR